MIRRLVQRIAESALSGRSQDDLQKLLDTLKLDPGLASRAVAYIRTGEDRPVLAALTAQKVQYRNLEGYCRTFQNEPEQLARYVEVVSAALNLRPHRSSYNKQVTSEMPDLVVNLFQLLGGSRTSDDQASEITFEDVLKATEILGGTPADLITYVVPTRYGSRMFSVQGKSINDLLHAFPASDYETSLNRRSSADRALVLGNLRSYPVAKDGAFLGYLLECAASKSAKLQEIAVTMLQNHDPASVLAGAKPLLESRAAATRAGAARAIGQIGSDEALALLNERLKVEKAQNVLAIIRHFTGGAPAETSDAPEGTYRAIDGSFVTIPSFEPLVDDGARPLGPDDLAALEALDDKQHEKNLERYEKTLERYRAGDKFVRHKPTKPDKPSHARGAFDRLNGVQTASDHLQRYYRYSHLMPALEGMLPRLSDARLVSLAVGEETTLTSLIRYRYSLTGSELMARVLDGRIDIRQIVAAAKSKGMSLSHGETSAASESNLLSTIVTGSTPRLKEMWPITASHLGDVLNALPPQTSNTNINLKAIEMLADLPKLPLAALEGVFFAALDDRPRISAPAQALLQEAKGIDERVIEALKDKRQAVRASAARFLADRETTSAIKPLVARLKTEKSESARAQMISAVARLGGDTKAYLGRDGLMKEAEALVKKLPNTKISWVNLAGAPDLKWPDGRSVDPVIPDAWLRLALKLKDPSEALLFNLYFDQLEPNSVADFASWVLSSWISYDTQQPPIEEARKEALAQAKKTLARGSHYYQNTSEDQLAASILRYMRSEYSNSGSDSKGILALTHRAPPAKATAAIAAYLKKHGKRVSQAKTLVDVLYGMQTPEALQVLVATATRFKQRTVRELAEQRVAQIAELRNWSNDELADRSIPTGGIDEDGLLTLDVGEDAKVYTARLGSDLTVKLFNPNGKEVKAIPTGKDDNTKESKALLSSAKKTVKAAVAQQSTRLYDGMVAERKWSFDSWQRDFVTHPIMTRLIERIIWRGLAEDGSFVTAFRPTAEGDRLTADGDDADLSRVRFVDIAHTTTLSDTERSAWAEHLDDFEVTLLFPQINRPVITLGDEQKKLTAIEDRKGWLTDTFTLRGKATKAGFERGETIDGGGFYEYVKNFRSAGIRVVLEFTGSYLPEENLPAAITKMVFHKETRGRSTGLQLSQVPPMVLSEAWNDLHEIASVATFDKDWESKGLY